MKSAIITGATGAVGRALAAKLLDMGVRVTLVLRPGSARNTGFPEHPLLRFVYCGLDGLSALTPGPGETADVFYHLAWKGTTGAARNNACLQEENIRGTLEAVKAAKRFGCRRFIGAGSQAEYGRFEGKLEPATPAFPENGYGMAKLAAGNLSRLLAKELEMEHVWCRILSVYGPCDGEGSMVMSVIRQLQRGETPRLTPGGQLWDYLYSEDAAKALYLLGEKGVSGKTYVLGGGQARPLKEYVETIRDLVRPGGPLFFGAIPYSDAQVMHLEADITELTKDTGWLPETDFTEGIRRILASLSGKEGR